MAQKTPYTNFHALNLDWIIKRIKNVYNDENPPPYPVESVNGKTGVVVLTGTDIPVSTSDSTPVSTELAEKYTKPTSGIPASDLAPGVIPDPASVIDDNAGYQVYNKTWSAHKLLQVEAEIVDVENDVDDLNNSITQIHSDIEQLTVYRISGTHPASPIYPPADIGYSQTYIISAPPTLADNFRVIGYYIPQEEHIKDLTVTITPGETQTVKIDFLIGSGSPSGTYEIYIVATDTTGGA